MTPLSFTVLLGAHLMVDADCIHIQEVIYSPTGFAFSRDDDILKGATRKAGGAVHLLAFRTTDAQQRLKISKLPSDKTGTLTLCPFFSWGVFRFLC